MPRFGLMTIVLLAVSAGSVFGNIVPACTSPGDALSFALSATDSYTCGDKVFSAFTSTGGITGTVSLTELNTDQYKLSFSAAGGGFASAFTFGYTVTALAGWNISQIQASMLTGVAIGGGASIPNASTGVLTLSSGAFAPGTVSGANAPAQNTLANVSTQSETVGFSYNPSGAPANGADAKFVSLDYIINQTSDLRNGSDTPEPAPLALIGTGLLALGCVRRRVRS